MDALLLSVSEASLGQHTLALRVVLAAALAFSAAIVPAPVTATAAEQQQTERADENGQKAALFLLFFRGIFARGGGSGCFFHYFIPFAASAAILSAAKRVTAFMRETLPHLSVYHRGGALAREKQKSMRKKSCFRG